MEIVTGPTASSVNVGDTAKMVCKVTDGVITWLKNNKTIPKEDRIRFVELSETVKHANYSWAYEGVLYQVFSMISNCWFGMK